MRALADFQVTPPLGSNMMVERALAIPSAPARESTPDKIVGEDSERVSKAPLGRPGGQGERVEGMWWKRKTKFMEIRVF